ncbi:MAG: hypothetical protein JNJ69_13685, partial [Leptospiraceae bacterium]|nr:hypothetical protein [Leptospiraceae bacterium]
MNSRVGLTLCSLIIAAIAGAGTFLYADAAHPGDAFTKYLIAARSPALLSERASDFSFLYLFFVKALGTDANLILFTQCILHIFVALLASLTTFQITRDLRWMLVSGVLIAAYRPFLTYAGVHEPESLLLFILSLIFFLTTWLLKRTTVTPLLLIVISVLALLIFTAGLIRPQYLLMIPAYAYWLSKRLRWKAAIWSVIVLTGTGATLMLFFSAAKPPMNPGTVFYEGNNPFAAGLTRGTSPLIMELEAANRRRPDYAHEAYRRIAAYANNISNNQQLTNKYWFGLSLAYIKNNPLLFFKAQAKKLVYVFAPFEPHDTFAAASAEERLRGKAFTGFWICILILPAILLLFPKNKA